MAKKGSAKKEMKAVKRREEAKDSKRRNRGGIEDKGKCDLLLRNGGGKHGPSPKAANKANRKKVRQALKGRGIF